jgi:lysozyme
VKVSNAGLNFIAGYEGFRGRAYNDQAGHATIGFGHLLHFGPTTASDRKLNWTRATGIKVFAKDILRYQEAVDRYVTVPLAQAQFDALVSLCFNIGIIGFRDSTLLRKLNAEDRRGAADEFLRWNKAGGRVSLGLSRRRAAERKLFLTGLTKPGNKPKPKPLTTLAKGPSKSFTWLEVHRGRKPWNLVLRARAILIARKLEQLKAEINRRRVKHGLKPTGINVLSWYRPEWYNKQVGGAKLSRHIKADAVDISKEEIKRLMPWKGGVEEFDWLANTLQVKDGFGQYPAGNRHLDERGFRARWSSW